MDAVCAEGESFAERSSVTTLSVMDSVRLPPSSAGVASSGMSEERCSCDELDTSSFDFDFDLLSGDVSFSRVLGDISDFMVSSASV